MNKQVLILIGGALFVVLIAAVLITSMLGDKPAEVVEAKEEPVVKEYVLVASVNLPRGKQIIDGDLQWTEWSVSNSALMEGLNISADDDRLNPKDGEVTLKASDFPDLIITENEGKSPNDVLDGRMRKSVMEGRPVMKKYIFSGKGNVVSMSLEEGMRAMAIKTNAESMVGGFIWPGDYVDVVLTYKAKPNSSLKKFAGNVIKQKAAETILQNIRVLAIDQDATTPPSDDGTVAKTITLEVSVKDAEKLAVAQDIGGLTLILRGFGDDTIVGRKWPVATDARVTNVDEDIVAEYLKNNSSNKSSPVKVYEGEARK